MITERQMQENKKKIIGILKDTKRKGIENLIGWLEDSNFFTSPASTMFHGNYEGGLAAHSYEVYEEFKRQVSHYGLNVPEESVAIASIGHDLCKVDLYVENKLKDGKPSDAKPYKTEDKFPIGHGEKSAMLVQKYILLTEQEAVLIRWHMSYEDPAWEDYKDKVERLFPEVILFQHADSEVSLLKKI